MGYRPPPPQKKKIFAAAFFVCGIDFVGIAGNIGNMVTGNTVSGINSMGLLESLAGSQHSVRRCELVMNKDYQK